ncbi:MAG TPA: methyltransferase domain-containing protein [Solirubrobacteraceae bacterium]|jgi:ubiquinone/menaquinone biosynthesis C-methylase UbiE
MSIDYDAFKDGQRSVWSAGDYPDVASTIEEAAAALLLRMAVEPGQELLDVATGSGNVAVPAAEAGAAVTGLDLTPKLLEAARIRAEQAGVQVAWVEGDAEALPFAGASFDRVTSCFGVIFAPRHELAAGELARVARPGASIGVTAWTREGLMGRFFRTVGGYMPAPPPELGAPVQWGDEEYVRSLLDGEGASVTCERLHVTYSGRSPEEWVAYQERTLGPVVMARAALEPQGRWEDLREELLALYSDANEADDGSFVARAEYLLSIAAVPA